MATSPASATPQEPQYKKRDFRQEVTDNIVKLLESNLAPWQKPWGPVTSPGAIPLNPTTGKAYRGGNAVHLMAVGIQHGYADPRWMTYKQAADRGWQVRNGEKGSQIEFWDVREQKTDKTATLGGNPTPDDQRERERSSLIHRVYTVFNAQQIDGVPAHEAKRVSAFEAIQAGEQILERSDAKIFHDQADRAFYSRSQDTIHLPPKEAFKESAGYYGTALHEMAHASGHPSRLNRSTLNDSYKFGDTNYAKEELRAELASVFIAAETGIPHDPKSHAAYVKSWIQLLKEDKNEIFRAAHDASAATDYMMGAFRGQQMHAPSVLLEKTELPPGVQVEIGTTTVEQKNNGKEGPNTVNDRPAHAKLQDRQIPPAQVTSLTEATAVATKALGDGIRTFSTQTESGIYRGTVVGATDEYLVQRVSSQSAVAHYKADFNNTPPIGSNVSITYSNGHGSVRELRERTKTPERTR